MRGLSAPCPDPHPALPCAFSRAAESTRHAQTPGRPTLVPEDMLLPKAEVREPEVEKPRRPSPAFCESVIIEIIITTTQCSG